MVVLRSSNEIEGLRRAGDLVARAFEMLRPHVVPGVGLDELDRLVEEFLRARGAESPYKGYRPAPSIPPFPGTVCASANEQVVHGIPSRRKLRGGDIVGIDVGPCSVAGSGTPATRTPSEMCLPRQKISWAPPGRAWRRGWRR